MSSPERKYSLLALGIVLMLAGGLAVLNYVVDPYNRFGVNKLGVYISADREYKATEVRRYPHDALLIGNSRVGGIPPEQLNGFHFFNGSFAGATSEEIYYFLSHFAQKDRLVILAVDLGEHDPPVLRGDIFAPATCALVLSNLFSLKTAEYSFHTIFERFAGVPSPRRANGWNDMAFGLGFEGKAADERSDWLMKEIKDGMGTFGGAARERMSFYEKIARCLKERQITCVVLIPPLHVEVSRYIQSLPTVSAAYEQWRVVLHSIFPDVVDLSYSEYGAPENFYRADPGHFSPETGVRILNEKVIPVALRALGLRTNATAAAVNLGAPASLPASMSR